MLAEMSGEGEGAEMVEAAPIGGGPSTLTVTAEQLGGKKLAAGDTVTFQVASVGEDGSFELAMSEGEDSEPSMEEELREAVAEPGGMPEDLQEGY